MNVHTPWNYELVSHFVLRSRLNLPKLRIRGASSLHDSPAQPPPPSPVPREISALGVEFAPLLPPGKLALNFVTLCETKPSAYPSALSAYARKPRNLLAVSKYHKSPGMIKVTPRRIYPLLPPFLREESCIGIEKTRCF